MVIFADLGNEFVAYEFSVRSYVSSAGQLRGKFQFDFPEIFHDGLILISKSGVFWTSKANFWGSP